MKTLGEIYQLSKKFLEEKKIENARRSAEEIIASVLNFSRTDLYMNFEKPLVEEELSQIRNLLQKRREGTPLEYVLGEISFYGLSLKVTPAALIPRPETEILVDLIAKDIEKEGAEKKVLWDIGTGSGAIGLSLKKAFPELAVTLSDLSEEALSLARENAQKNGLSVSFCKGDLFEPFAGKKADYIVSNPPYIGEEEELDPEVVQCEPNLALFAGKSGLHYYERFEKEMPPYLEKSAKIFFEMGKDQGNSLKNLFSAPFWTKKEVLPDWAGHDRFFFLEIE